MADTQASDLFFTAGAPVQIKIKGEVVPVDNQILDAATMKKIAYEAMNEEQIAPFRAGHGNQLFARSRKGVGSFRVNIFRQRGACGMVIRHIKAEHSHDRISCNLPQTLKDVVMEKRGLILVVGSTGSGKSSTLAAMINHRNHTQAGHILTIEDPIEFMYKHAKSIVNQREVGIDTKSYHNALVNAMREAPDVITDRRVPRPRDFRRGACSTRRPGTCVSRRYTRTTATTRSTASSTSSRTMRATAC